MRGGNRNPAGDGVHGGGAGGVRAPVAVATGAPIRRTIDG